MLAPSNLSIALCFLIAFGAAFGIRRAAQPAKTGVPGEGLLGRETEHVQALLGPPLRSFKATSGKEFHVYESWRWMRVAGQSEWIPIKRQPYEKEDRINDYIVVPHKDWEDWRRRTLEFYRDK